MQKPAWILNRLRVVHALLFLFLVRSPYLLTGRDPENLEQPNGEGDGDDSNLALQDHDV